MHMRLLSVLTALLFISTASPAAELGPRHAPTGKNSAFAFDMATPFAEYLARTRALIAETRVDLTDANREQVIDDNSPYEWVPDSAACPDAEQGGRRRGALLIHGLTDSPYLMRDVGRQLVRNCFLVRSLLLPGHGTVPGDLFEVTDDDWVQAVRYGIRSFADGPTDVIVVDFSTGAAAALYNQLSGGAGAELVKALVLLSPAIELKSKFAFAANWYKFRRIFVAMDVKTREDFERRGWIDIAADEDTVKYESFTKNAADQIHKLTKKIGDLSPNSLSVPLFVAISADDNTVSAEGAVRFFEGTVDPRNRLVLYTRNTDARTGEDARILRRRSAHLDLRILDYSHTAIPVAPESRHYGRDGAYRNCMHYLEEPDKWAVCKSGGPDLWLGENTPENLDAHTLQRLTYNPGFADLTQSIVAFLEGAR